MIVVCTRSTGGQIGCWLLTGGYLYFCEGFVTPWWLSILSLRSRSGNPSFHAIGQISTACAVCKLQNLHTMILPLYS
ncbi:hypothetical protein ACOSP7_000684 [Xanthoceras sorbifolium]